MPSYKLIVQNAKVILKTMANYVINLTGIKDNLTGTGNVTNNVIDWELQLGYKNTAWFTANASVVLLVGQIVYLEQTGTYKIGNGVTALSALSFLGGGSGSGVQSVTGANVDNTDPLNPIIEQSLISPDANSAVIAADFQINMGSGDGIDTSSLLIQPDSIQLTSNSVTKNGVEIATVNDLDAKQNKAIIVSTSITAVLDSEYVMNATSTFTDPTPSEGKGFTVFVLNGTATVGGITYSVVGTIIKRFYHSGAWLNEVYFDKAFYDTVYSPLASPTFTGTVTTPAIIVSSETASTIASFDASKNIKSLALATYPSLTELSYGKGVTSAIQTQLNTKVGVIVKDITTGSALTGTTAITLIKSVLIPANTFTTGDICQIVNRAIRSTATGSATNYIYVNTSASLSGATLVGTQSAASRFYGMERNLYIKSSTVSETFDTAISASGDNPTTLANANSNLNIDWTVDQYIIHAFANAAVGNSTVSSGLFVTKF